MSWSEIMKMSKQDIQRKLNTLTQLHVKEPKKKESEKTSLPWADEFRRLVKVHSPCAEQICIEFFGYCIDQEQMVSKRIQKEIQRAQQQAKRELIKNEKRMFQKRISKK